MMREEAIRLTLLSSCLPPPVAFASTLIAFNHVVAAAATVAESRYNCKQSGEISYRRNHTVPCAAVRSSTTNPLGPYQLASIILMKGVGVCV